MRRAWLHQDRDRDLLRSAVTAATAMCTRPAPSVAGWTAHIPIQESTLSTPRRTGSHVPPVLPARDLPSRTLPRLFPARSYTHFCRCGKLLDGALEAAGAQRLVPRVDVNKEDWPAIDAWLSGGAFAGVVRSLP